jgi:hypothetical protein
LQLSTDTLWDRQYFPSSDEIAVRQSLFARRAAAPWRAYFSFRGFQLLRLRNARALFRHQRQGNTLWHQYQSIGHHRNTPG